MTKSFFCFLLAIFFISGTIKASAQTADNRWGIGLHGGMTRLNDDFDNYYFKTNQQQKFGSISISTFISPHLTGGLTLLAGDLRTYNTVINDLLKTTIRSGDLSLTYSFLPEDFVLHPYISAGAGLLYADNFRARKQYSPVFPLGLGLKVIATERIHFDINARQYTSFLDQLDGTEGGENNDNYLGLSAGIIFNLGKISDADGDKVSNNRDDCPGTKPGVKVTRMGCPVDSDEDGIEDVFDNCPDLKGIAKFGGCPDTDGDSIEDSKDKCPDIKGIVKFKGCPDSDNDGIEDAKDLCPKVSGLDAFNGCPDTDKDGIEDSKDKCPQVSGSSKLDGCPDTDGDGVEDSKDRCPAVAGLPGLGGCPEPKNKNADIKKLEAIAKKINFEAGKAVLKPVSFVVLDQVVTLMKANPVYKLSIEGHTDSGSAAMNLQLSQGRADAVKNYLVSKGVEGDRIVAAGFGDTKPIGDNKTAKGKALNRRSELKLF